MMNAATIGFVHEHRNDDVRSLALKARPDKAIDLPWALEQIQGWQVARKKLPSWASIPDIIYPPHLSMEQCSSEATALYKSGILRSLPQNRRGTLVDLTGGFGVDFSFMSRHFERAVYVEKQQHLCDVAQHNFAIMGLDNATIIHGDAASMMEGQKLESSIQSTWFYLDPARRDDNMARTYAIADCSPNVIELLPWLLRSGSGVLLKLSPMLDWHKAVKDLGQRVAQVHILSVGGECKELLILMKSDHDGEPTIYCINDGQSLKFTPSQDTLSPELDNDDSVDYLYEPNASIMKAGCFGVLCQHYPLKAISLDSHLFASSTVINDFPGRGFRVTAVSSMNKKDLAKALAGIDCANVAVRNFPMSARQLRSRLRLKDGGDTYIFGATTSSRLHRIYICKKL